MQSMNNWTTKNDPIEKLKKRVQSEEAKEAIEIADEVSELILFHARVRKNGILMSQPVKEGLKET